MPTQPGRDAHANALSRLEDPDFVNKLVFVGANECYNEDVARFVEMFGISQSFMEEHPVTLLRGKRADSFDSKNLSVEAITSLREYFSYDYDIFRSLASLGLIKCQKLLDRLQ